MGCPSLQHAVQTLLPEVLRTWEEKQHLHPLQCFGNLPANRLGSHSPEVNNSEVLGCSWKSILQFGASAFKFTWLWAQLVNTTWKQPPPLSSNEIWLFTVLEPHLLPLSCPLSRELLHGSFFNLGIFLPLQTATCSQDHIMERHETVHEHALEKDSLELYWEWVRGGT